jgi:hypothetical protein
MKFTKQQIADFWNQAILNETGFEGRIIPQIFSYEDIEVTYKSKNDETIIKLLGTNLAFDFENETVVLGSKNGLSNFHYYY